MSTLFQKMRAHDNRSEAVSQGSYGRGVYAGQSTFGLDFSSQGSYGRGVYAGQSTHGFDFQHRGSYARGMSAAGAD